MTLREKILDHFPGKAVRKDLTSLVKGNAVVPTYVLEYLLGQYCAIDDEEIIEMGIEKVRKVISHNYVHRSEAEEVKHIIREEGSHKIIDKVNVTLNDKDNLYQADFANLGIKRVPVADSFVSNNKKLLSGGGVWCILDMAYSHAVQTDVRWIITNLKPIQVANVDLQEYGEARAHFTLEEWMDLLLHTIGLNPEYFSRRGKLIQLSRLIPHVENNYNFIELGPKGTGKSHVFSELSPHGVLVSGGDVSKARLFVSNVGNKLGLVGYWDVVALDEFEQEKGSKRTDGDMVKIMQNYMANQSFNRGKETYQATASMVFVGNTKHNVPYMLKNSHLFESIPEGYIKGAFLDRMHMYIPGWEVKILKNEVFSSDYGFIVDYLAEILKELRKEDYSPILDKFVDLDGSLTTRDKRAIRKSFSGMVKILFPHREITEKEALDLLNFAMEGRKRVKTQLYVIDETFKKEPVDFKYKVLSSGREAEVETLEVISLNANMDTNPLDELVSSKTVSLDSEKVPEKRKLKAGQFIIHDGQTGISYRKLFADYLKGASIVRIQDPYIRHPHQFRNLFEFAMMLSEIKDPSDEIYLELTTFNEPDYLQQSYDNLVEFQQDIAQLGIQFQYFMEDQHDRYIEANNGWKIVLARIEAAVHALEDVEAPA
ncbi:MAG: BREX system Lon protease-like protein BrxL [Bacteroidota bacterium]